MSIVRKLELETETLREKCPNTKFLLVSFFPHLDGKRRDTEYLSVFSRNAANRDQKKLLIWTLFTRCFPYFPVFSRNAEKYGSEKNSVFGHFSRSEIIGFKASSRNLIVVSL